MNRGKIMAVLGAQYGDEGKGSVTAYLANEYDVHVRAGSPQAEHTFEWRGQKHTMKQIPCGWINPDAKIVIGRGALVYMKQLIAEITHIETYYPDFRKRLYIDPKAGVLDERFVVAEGGFSGEIHQRIGSCAEGVGPARAARISRNPEEFYHFGDIAEQAGFTDCYRSDTPRMLADWQDEGQNILIEGTQGVGLSLIHGQYPYVTSADISAAQMLSECGIAPGRLTNVMLIVRTYPMRVPGNSGPMKNEITWEELSKRIGKPVKDYGLILKEPLRIAEWDDELLEVATTLNAPTSIAITFMDYLEPDIEGCRREPVYHKDGLPPTERPLTAYKSAILQSPGGDKHQLHTYTKAMELVEKVSKYAPISVIRTGGTEDDIVDFGHR